MRWLVPLLLTSVLLCQSPPSKAPFDDWLERARSHDVRTQLEAAFPLRDISNADGSEIERFWLALHDPNRRVRQYAVTALGDLGNPDQSKLSSLVALLGDADPLVRADAVITLGKAAESVPDSLIRYLNLVEIVESKASGNDLVRDGIADYLAISIASAGPSIMVPWLRGYEGFDRPSSRPRIQFIFGSLGVDAWRVMVQALGCGNSDLSANAFKLLVVVNLSASLSETFASVPPIDCPDGSPVPGKASSENPVLRHLFANLVNTEPGVAEIAARSLGNIGNAAAVPDLLERLQADEHSLKLDWRVRLEIVRALGRIGRDQAIVPALHNVLERDSRSEVRREAAVALTNLDSATPELFVMLANLMTKDDTDPSDDSVHALAQMWRKGRAYRSTVMDSLQNEGPTAQNVARAIGLIGPEAADAAPALVLALRQKDVGLRALAAEALGRIGPNAADVSGTALTLALKDKQPLVRQSAAQALALLGANAPPESVPILEKLLTSGGTEAQRAAAEALARMGAKTVIPTLIKMIDSQYDSQIAAAAQALGLFGSPASDAVPSLAGKLMSNPAPDTMSTLAIALGQIHSNASVSLPALMSIFPANRAAVEAIIAFRGQAVPYLTKVIQDRDAKYQQQAASVLARIGPDAFESVPVLKNLLDSPRASVRSEALHAISAIAPREFATDSLVRMLGDTDDSVRYEAVLALSEVETSAFPQTALFRANRNDLCSLHYLQDALTRLQEYQNVDTTSGKKMGLFSALATLFGGSGSRHGTSEADQQIPAELLPFFPVWPLPQPSTRQIVPNDRFGAEHETLGQAYDQLIEAMGKAGFLDRSLFQTPTGFAVVTRMERMHDDGSSYEEKDRWTRNKMPLRSLNLVEYLGRLLWESPGQFRMFVILFSTAADVVTDSGKLTESAARSLAIRDGQDLPHALRGVPFRQYSCQVLVYHFEKSTNGDADLEVPSAMQAMTHIQKSHILGKLVQQ